MLLRYLTPLEWPASGTDHLHLIRLLVYSKSILLKSLAFFYYLFVTRVNSSICVLLENCFESLAHQDFFCVLWWTKTDFFFKRIWLLLWEPWCIHCRTVITVAYHGHKSSDKKTRGGKIRQFKGQRQWARDCYFFHRVTRVDGIFGWISSLTVANECSFTKPFRAAR